LDLANYNLFTIDFLESKYKNNINIGYNDIKKLVIHPKAVKYPLMKKEDEEEAQEKYELLKSFNENIKLSPELLNPLKQLSLPTKPISKLIENN
jgi:hypothetical protein